MEYESLLQKIHFIKVCDFDYDNAGDIFCSPYLWYYDFFKDYSCIFHSISSIRYNTISKNDIVILGGGGLLDYDPWINFNKIINEILLLCDNVVIWGAGYNCCMKDDKMVSIEPPVNINKFKICGIRDYSLPGIRYLPCVSCKNPLLKKAQQHNPSKKVGSMLHPLMITKTLPIPMDNLSHFNEINKIMEFIADHEVIVTNSYHCAIWSMMANRKVVSPDWALDGNKFTYLRHPPAYCDWMNKNELEYAIGVATAYPGYLEESIRLNDEFFEEVKKLIRSTILVPNKAYEQYYQQSMIAEFYWKMKKDEI